MSTNTHKTRGVVAASALALGAFMAAAAPAAATTPTTAPGSTTTLTSPIKAGNEAKTVGEATLTRTRAADGATTVVVRGVTQDEIKESHLCYDDEPYTKRVSPGQCQLQGVPNGNTVQYTVNFPASDADRTIYFQFHVVTKGKTAYAGWQPGDPFFGNLAMAAPDGGTELPMGSLGGVLLAGGAAVALWAATRRRSVAVPSNHN